MSGHPLSTTAALRRALTPGTVVHIENHRWAGGTRTTVVQPQTNTVDLVTKGRNRQGEIVKSYLPWPKRDRLVPVEGREDQVQLLDKQTREAFATITVLPADRIVDVDEGLGLDDEPQTLAHRTGVQAPVVSL